MTLEEISGILFLLFKKKIIQNLSHLHLMETIHFSANFLILIIFHESLSIFKVFFRFFFIPPTFSGIF